MRSLEIGIPILKSLEDAQGAIARAVLLPGVSAIHLSVNDPGDLEERFEALTQMDSRVRVTLQRDNLGLYGNLRFLAQSAAASHFSWLAADDILTRDFVEAFLNRERPTKLSVSNFVHQICVRNPTISWDLSSTVQGWWPEPKDDGRWQYFSTEPSWIFGIWETSYLKKIFPSKSYDFLDTILLAHVLFDDEISLICVKNPSVIGLWPNRPPNHVNGKYHGFSKWAGEALKLLVRREPLSAHAWRGLLTALIGRCIFSTRSKYEYFRKRKN
jgi:hypothetical protein